MGIKIINLFQTFKAFNINGFSNLAYILMSNWWFLLIMFSAIVSIIMFLREEIVVTVHEEQSIL